MKKYETPVMEVELFDENKIEMTEDMTRSGDKVWGVFSEQKPC